MPSKSKKLYDQPMSWTRVKNIDLAVNQRVTVFDVEKDLSSDKALKKIRKDINREPTALVFDPESFSNDQGQLSFARHTLD